METKRIEFTHYFAVPGSRTVVDVVHPNTGKSLHYDETLEQVRVRYPGAELINCDDWHARRAAEQDSAIEWIEVTEDRYHEMMNVLPPERMKRGAFLVGEPMDHHAMSGKPRFDCFIRRGDGKYFASSRPLTVTEFEKVEV